MPVHTLERSIVIPASLEKAWAFFSDPRNLRRITPENLGFEILTPGLPEAMHAGMMIEYRVRPLLGLPMRWLTEITQVRPLEYFVDEQRRGPYALWHHEHWFRGLDGGRVEMRDRVTYALPFGWLGDLAHPWLVAPQLQQIFAHREKVVRELFAE